MDFRTIMRRSVAAAALGAAAFGMSGAASASAAKGSEPIGVYTVKNDTGQPIKISNVSPLFADNIANGTVMPAQGVQTFHLLANPGNACASATVDFRETTSAGSLTAAMVVDCWDKDVDAWSPSSDGFALCYWPSLKPSEYELDIIDSRTSECKP